MKFSKLSFSETLHKEVIKAILDVFDFKEAE